jgi:hypothetical protein
MGHTLFETFTSSKKDKIMTARDSYFKSKYGKEYTDEELMKNLSEEIKNGIKYKCECGKYCAMFEIDVDKEKFVPSIVEKYRDNGYQVILIKNDTNLDGKVLSKLNSMFLIFIWNNIQVQDEIGKSITSSEVNKDGGLLE